MLIKLNYNTLTPFIKGELENYSPLIKGDKEGCFIFNIFNYYFIMTY